MNSAPLSGAPLSVPSPLPETGRPAPVSPASWWRHPFGWSHQLVRRLYTEQVDATGLAFFRILFFLVFLGEILCIFYFRDLRFDLIPGVKKYDLSLTIPLIIWMASVILIVLGLFTRRALLLNYLLCLVFISTPQEYEYHMDYTWLMASFLVLFIPLEQRYSLDRLRWRLRYTGTHQQYVPPRTVNKLSYYALIFFCITVTYSSSMLCKLPAQLWQQGMGFWSPLAAPFAVHLDLSWAMNNKFISIFLGYLSLFFEMLFGVLFVFRRARPWLALVGVGLHFGIFLAFPIPWFALGWCALYILVMPPAFWQWLTGETRNTVPTAPQLTFYYDAECLLCARTRATIAHFDTRHRISLQSVQQGAAAQPALEGISPEVLYADVHAVRHDGRVFRGLAAYVEVLKNIWYLRPLAWLLQVPGISHLANGLYRWIAADRTVARCTEETCGYSPPHVPASAASFKLFRSVSLADVQVSLMTAGMLLLLLFQVIVSYKSPLVANWRRDFGILGSPLDEKLMKFEDMTEDFSSKLFGIINHGVFIDSHFAGYNHALAVTYVHPDGHEEFLPITRPTGQPSWYTYSGLWARWCFRVNGPVVFQDKLFDGIQDFSAFWAMKHNISLDNARFNLKVKKVAVTFDWEYERLHKQMANPWLDGGYVQWTKRVASPHLKEVEKI